MVENYPGFPEGIDGYELMARLQKQAERFGARVKFGSVEAVDLSRQPFGLTVDGEPVAAETIIIASGASHRHLGLESEHKLENKGVTYCATCDGALPIFRDQPLVVVGGGDSACEEAMYLTRFGSIVYLVHRRDTLRASKIMAERALAHAKIKPIWDSVVTEVLGREARQGHGRALEERQDQRGKCGRLRRGLRRHRSCSQHAALQGRHRYGRERLHHPQAGNGDECAGRVCGGRLRRPVYRQAVTAAGLGCAAAIEAERYLAARNE